MGIEVEHAFGDIQTTTTPSSIISTSGPKISMFAKKSGFVIPKNKLSGSLVPIFRGTKNGDADLANEEATSQVQRKTKWGPDLTQDTSVRKGRVLAYQTRIDQISQQLTLGTLELEGDEDPFSASVHQLNKEELEMLELEKREIIGEVLKLNPTFKAPADYKPLLKEAKIPVPIKEYPGYNFISLVFGPANDTQKRLEKETGAKIQVYGTKSDTGAKVEIIPTDGKEINNAYEDVYVQVSANTFEKIDAAVALIELLLTPVSANTVSSSTTPASILDNNMDTHKRTLGSIISPAPINQQSSQPYPESFLPPQGQLPQYRQPWFSSNLTHIPPFFPTTPSDSSSPLLSDTVQVSSSPFNPTTTMPSLFGPRPIIATNFRPILQNPSVFSPRPQSVVQPPYMQQASPMGQMGGPRNTPGPSLTGPPYNVRPVLSTLTPPIVTSHGHNNAMASQNMAVSRPPLVNIPNNVIGPLFGPSPSESARPRIQTSPIGLARPAMLQAIRPGGAPMPSFQSSTPNSIFGGPQNFDNAKPISASISRPQRPSFGDFTFQPHNRPPNVDSQVWQSNQPVHHNVRPPLWAGPGPQPPMLRPANGNLNPSSVHSSPRFQINQPRAQIQTNFFGSPTGTTPSRHPIMPTGSHMHLRNFSPTQHINNSSGPFPPRSGPHMQIPEYHLRPHQKFSSPHQRLGNYPGRPFPSSSGGPQVYDPFSPTSVPFNGQMGGKAMVHGDSDPEYEDLMASVGVQ